MIFNDQFELVRGASSTLYASSADCTSHPSNLISCTT